MFRSSMVLTWWGKMGKLIIFIILPVRDIGEFVPVKVDQSLTGIIRAYIIINVSGMRVLMVVKVSHRKRY